jgi:hypothetical protein
VWAPLGGLVVIYVIYVYCALLQVRQPRLRKVDSLELTTGMSVTATDYTYALYNGQTFLLVRNGYDRHVAWFACAYA